MTSSTDSIRNCSGKIFRGFLSIAISTAVVGLSACSSTSTGTGTEDGLGGSLSENDLNAQREGRFGNGSIPTAEGEGMFRDVNFGYDSFSLDDTARQDVEFNARVLEDQPNLKLILEGHCDERGTVEYNMALGAERARSVKSALVALGISSSRLDSISYGEEVPLDPGHDEAAYAKNRRVHFSATRGAAR